MCFLHAAAALESAVDDQLQLFDEILGFQDVIEGAHLQCLNRCFGAGEGR